MHFFLCVVCVTFCSIYPAIADTQAREVYDFMPLLERNSILNKVIDVRYSVAYGVRKENVHLVFEADTGKYREEVEDYAASLDKDFYLFSENIWNGEKYISWKRLRRQHNDAQALEKDLHEYSGRAHIGDRSFTRTPLFVSHYYDRSFRPFAKSVCEQQPQLRSLSGNTVVIETLKNRFEFAKSTCALMKIEYLYTRTNNTTVAWKTYELSNHVDCSGIWVPIRITLVERNIIDGKERCRGDITVDPKTLRLIDAVDDSCFSVSLPTGCVVQDDVLKKNYVVTTLAANPPQDVEAMKKTLEKMLEQAEEQKAAVEKKK